MKERGVQGVTRGRGARSHTPIRALVPRNPEISMLLTITTTYTPASDLGYLLHKHMRELQSLDRVNQLLAHIGRVISAQDRRQAAAAITLEDLRARLLRTGLAEDPVPPVGH